MYTTLLPSMHQPLPALRQTPLPRWQSLRRTAQIRSLSFLATLQKRPSSLGLLKKRQTRPREWPPDATKPLTVPQDPFKEKEVPPKMEIVLATLLVLAKGDFKGKDQGSSMAALS